MVLAWRRSKYTTIDIRGISVDKWRRRIEQRTGEDTPQENVFDETSNTLVSSVRYASTTQSVTIECEDSVANSE